MAEELKMNTQMMLQELTATVQRERMGMVAGRSWMKADAQAGRTMSRMAGAWRMVSAQRPRLGWARIAGTPGAGETALRRTHGADGARSVLQSISIAR